MDTSPDLEPDIEHVILKHLVEAMKRVGVYNGLTGDEKKNMVIKDLHEAFEIPEPLLQFVINMIDILINVEKGRIVFNPKVKPVVASGLSFCCGKR